MTGAFLLLFLFSALQAAWPAGTRKIMVVGNKNDMAVAKSELTIREKLRKLMDDGKLDRDTMKIAAFDYSVGEHKKHLERLGISAFDLPLLGLAELNSEGAPVKIFWKIRAQDPSSAISALCSEMGITISRNPGSGDSPPGDGGTNSAPSKKDQAMAMVKTADGYFGSGNYTASIQEYNRAIETDQACATAYYGRGAAYYNSGEYGKAVADLSLYISFKPKDFNSYKFRGYSLHKLKELDRAMDDYEKLIQLNPNAPEGYTGRGNIYRQRGDINRAIGEYDKAISYKPDFAAAYFCRADSYFEKGEYDKAITDCSQAISLKPDYSDALLTRGNCHYNKRMYEKAIEDYTQVIGLCPGYLSAYSNRAKSYFCLKDYTKAWADVKKCRETGGTIDDSFLEQLRKASGKKE